MRTRLVPGLDTGTPSKRQLLTVLSILVWPPLPPMELYTLEELSRTPPELNYKVPFWPRFRSRY
jgi:hypothetical protein